MFGFGGNSGPSDPAAKQAKMMKIILTIALAIPILLETLDYTVVATAQPVIASIFHRLDLQSWIGTAYLLTSTVFLPLFASMADIFGRHTTLQLSLFLFLAGSALCTGAQNIVMLLAGRGLSGVGAAGLLTVVRTILADTASLDESNSGLSIMFTLYAIGTTIGPLVGGELLNVSFRWIFGINLPLAGVAMVLAFFLLRGRVKGGSTAMPVPFTVKLLMIDWVGAVLFIGAGILVMLGLSWGSTGKWDDHKVIISFAVGGALLILFLLWEAFLGSNEDRAARSAQGGSSLLAMVERLLPLDILIHKDIAIVQFASFASGMVMLVMFYFVATFLVVVRNLKPSDAGVALIWFAPGMGVGSFFAVTIVKRLRQPRYSIVAGAAVTTASLILIALAMSHNNQTMTSWYLAMAGAGTGLSLSPLAIQARFSVAEERNAVVVGLTLFARSLGGTVGLAQCGAVLNSKVTASIAAAVRSGAIPAADAAQLKGALSSVTVLDSLSPATQTAVRAAYQHAVKWCFFSLVPWCGLALFLTLFLSAIHPEQQAQQAANRTAKAQRGSDDVEMQGSRYDAPSTSYGARR